MVFVFAIIIAVAAVIADNLYGHDGIVFVLLGAPFVVPAFAIMLAVLKGFFGLFVPQKKNRW